MVRRRVANYTTINLFNIRFFRSKSRQEKKQEREKNDDKLIHHFAILFVFFLFNFILSVSSSFSKSNINVKQQLIILICLYITKKLLLWMNYTYKIILLTTLCVEDRATLCVVLLLSFIFSTVLIAYGTQIQLPTMKDSFEHGNNSHIWFRDMPIVKERNNSEAAQSRLPTLYLSFEKLRLTHFEEISHVPLRDVGDYDKGVWLRKSMIGALWLRLFDDVDTLRRVCHMRLGAGYIAIMYLEALPDAEILIYDTCDGDQEVVCNTIEGFLKTNYPSRNITIRRTSSPVDDLLADNKSF